MKKSLLILPIAIACGTAKMAQLSPADAELAAAKFPGTTLQDLQTGQQLYYKHCGNCHSLVAPASQTEEQWSYYVPKMAEKVNRKEGPVLDKEKEKQILHYVLTLRSKTQ